MLSPYIMAIIAAWVAAQGAKYIIAVVKSGTLRNFRQLYVSGNMPSAHSASVIALVTGITPFPLPMDPWNRIKWGSTNSGSQSATS